MVAMEAKVFSVPDNDENNKYVKFTSTIDKRVG